MLTTFAYIAAGLTFLALAANTIRLTRDLRKMRNQIDTECQHAWTPWELRGEHPIHSDDKRIGFLKVQERQCALCGFREFSLNKIEP